MELVEDLGEEGASEMANKAACALLPVPAISEVRVYRACDGLAGVTGKNICQRSTADVYVLVYVLDIKPTWPLSAIFALAKAAR